MSSIIKELNFRVNQNPEKLLYAFLDIKGNIKQSYTYSEFQHKTDGIASFIYENYNLKPGDRILLAYPPGLEIICAFFACVKLGLIPVPVYPPSAQGFHASLYKMEFIAKDSGAIAILTDRSYYWSIKVNLVRKSADSFLFKSNLISKLIWIVSEDCVTTYFKPFPHAHSSILFLQYTSGSTNNPKGVTVTHQNIIENCNQVVDHLPIGVSWLPQYHDMGLIGYYIFFALKGGTTYGFSPLDFIQRPALWLETISKYSATASSAPNFAFEYCLVPGKISEETFNAINLSSLSFLMTAAEPINCKVYKTFLEKFEPRGLKPNSFFAAYGLAEFTLAVTNYGRKILSFDSLLLKENTAKVVNTLVPDVNFINLISCGKPLGDTQIKIVDVSLIPKVLPNEKVGEIWLKGSSKCSGYWNKPTLTVDYFEAELDNEKWLRTGDLGFIYNDELFVCGRLKDLIIFRGLNFYPQDIEAIIEEDSMVRKGSVAAFSIEKNESELLVVIVGLKNKKNIPEANALNNKIIKLLGIGASAFVFVPARTISKTSSGKIMRYENKNRFLAKKLEIISQVDFELENGLITETKESKTHKEFSNNSNHFHSLFQRFNLSGTETESLGDAGLDSLKLVEFTHDLKLYLETKGYEDLSEEVDLRLIQKIAISELFEILQGLETSVPLSRFLFKNAFASIHNDYRKLEFELMKKDALLSNSLNLSNATHLISAFNKHILLTGGTGFFGPFLIKSLLEQNKEDIYVIVRATNTKEALKRLTVAFSSIQSSPYLKDEFNMRIKPICGDLSKLKFGLKNEDWNFLSNNIHTIYHNGAQVNYLFDYEKMRSINVEGTNEVISLALSSQPKIVNHISTTFIFGWSVKETLFETDSNKDMEFLDFGYSQSKWVSEQIVKNAIQQGIKARIFRPALISPSIEGDGYNFDISIRLLAFMLKYGIGTNAQNQVSFTPADLAANNIVAISNIEDSIGKTFHVTRDTYSTMLDVTNILSDLTGKKFTNFSLRDFVPEVVNRCGKNDLLFPLLNFLVRSVNNISAMEFKRYDNTNYRKYCDLSDWGKKDKPLTDVVKGILIFMQKQGIVEPKIGIKQH